MRSLFGYLRRIIKLWIWWIWAPILDLIGGVSVSFLPANFILPQSVYWAVLGLGFVAANFKLYLDLESEKLVLTTKLSQIEAGKVEAFKAARQEIEVNRAAAKHNADIKGSPSYPGALPFIHLHSESCKQHLLSGRFVIDDPLLEVAREYVLTIEHVNTLMQSVRDSTARFQDASASVEAIRRYCGGRMNEQYDGQAKSVPDVLSQLESLL